MTQPRDGLSDLEGESKPTSQLPQATGRILRGLLTIVVVLGALWAVSTLVQNQRRDEAVRQLLAQVAAAPDASVVDFASAFDLEWDRAVLIGPYWPGSAANDALGFRHYPDDEAVTHGDGTYLLVFARDRDVVAELLLDGQTFYFDEAVEEFDSQHAGFRVEGGGHAVVLTPAK